MVKKTFTQFFYTLIGLAFMGAAIFAHQLGLDHSPGWGKERVMVLVLGVLVTIGGIFAPFLFSHGIKAAAALQRIAARIRDHPLFSRMTDHRIVRSIPAPGSRKTYLLAGLLASLIIIFYIWLASTGLWTTFPHSTNYYDWLATSFQHGSLSLEIKPAPALLALPNPYNPVARAGIDIPGDVTLYHGKYYLYFGPAPALILTVVKQIIPGVIGDSYLVFAFVVGIFILQLFLALEIWNQFFHDFPGWTILIGIILIGLEAPVLMLIASPDFHQVAIAGGQFFFNSGLFLTFSAFHEKSSPARNLALAGISWVAAIGSRSTLIPSTGFMILMTILWTVKKSPSPKPGSTARHSILALGIPLVLGAAGLAWYNWARFGSPFEFGFQYQLTWNYIWKFRQILFSPAYILQNLYNYYLTPFHTSHLFPFFMVSNGKSASVFAFINLPSLYFAGPGPGLLYSMPLNFLALLPAINAAAHLFKRDAQAGERRILDWLSIGLFGSVVTAFITLLFFFWSTIRYLADLAPALTLLSVIGFWQGYSFFHRKTISRNFYVFMIIGVTIVSVILSTLLSISFGLERFRVFNPDLIHWLRNLFVGWD